ncbi:Protein DBF4 A [Chionoecetes opilio]|uniref:Protein DBF4 A n=1 Tax=Chionoecetes opilio TaxID=41210 RepID=A0A8J4XVA3_CHIOP|nr:Protein DBF4 A [Chionoecetes opilio]
MDRESYIKDDLARTLPETIEHLLLQCLGFHSQLLAPQLNITFALPPAGSGREKQDNSASPPERQERRNEEGFHLIKIVEEFLSREVSYVISTRGQQPAGGSSSEQQPSPSGALTPHQPLSSLPSTSHDSPLNLDSPREDSGKRRVRTRAEVLLERVCVRRQGTSDVLENARLWNVPVWPLTKLVNWLTVLKESGRYKPPKTNGALASKNSLSSSPKATRLQAPFIKTEAFTRQYKPLYKELPSWPELNLFNPCGVSLFADPKQARARQWPKSSASAVRNDHKDRRVRERIRGTKAKESGYCELCTTTYTNLTLHLKSDSHTAFVRNDKNYLYLDELISGEKQNCLIGDTIHSGPSLVAPALPKDEN